MNRDNGDLVVSQSVIPEKGMDSVQIEAMKAEIGPQKTTKNGKTILIPQPSDDPEDPLNWSWKKKHMVLATVSFAALLTDWGIAWGTTVFPQQAETWGMTVPAVANSVSGANFMQGVGGVLAVPLTQRYGRLPVLFWSQAITAILVLAAALSPSYAGFAACRTLQGFFNTAPQVIGLSIIHDTFFFHEVARKIGIWGWCFVTGPYLGPLFSELLSEVVSWRVNYGVLAALYAASSLFIIFCGRETLFDRDTAAAARSNHVARLTGVAGYRATGRPSVWKVFGHLGQVAIRPHVFAVCKYRGPLLAN